MTRVRVGVVGVGWWSARVHLPALAANPEAELAGLCDLDVTRASKLAAEYGVSLAVGDVASLLEADLDAVVVATPHDAHFSAAAAALDAGVDVLIEKPMAIVPGEAWDLVERARRSGARLHVGYVFPYTRHARALKAAIDEGRLGRLVLMTGLFATAMRPLLEMAPDRRERLEGDVVGRGGGTYSRPGAGGQLLAQATHCVALLLWLTGMRPQRVVAMSHGHDLAVDLVDALVVRSAEGALMSVASTGSVQDPEARVEEYRVFGDQCDAALDTARGTLALGGKERDRLARDEVYPAEAPTRRLVAAAQGDEPVLVDGELGAHTVDVLAAAIRSTRTGAEEPLERPAHYHDSQRTGS
jgi:predicted dehydrogenase